MAVLTAFRPPRVERRTLVAIGLAALAAFLVLILTRPAPSVDVLVAAVDIPAGAPLSDGAISVRSVADSDGHVAGSGLGDLRGWTLSVGVAAGEPLLPSLLVDPDAVDQPSALSISIPKSHAALGNVEAGDLVDIYVTWPASPGEPRRTELLAPLVEVLEARIPDDRLGTDSDIELLFAVDEELAPLIAGGHRIGDLDIVRVKP